MNTQKIYEGILSRNGYSYNPITGEENPTTGYMVSLLGYEKVVPVKEFSPDVLDKYSAQYKDSFTEESFIGAWIQGGMVYLDLSQRVDSLYTAVLRGIMRDQKAIWDCKLEMALNLPSPQTAGTEYQKLSYARQKAQEIVDRSGKWAEQFEL